MNVLKRIQPDIVSLTLLFMIVLSCMPTASIMAILIEESTQDESAVIDTLRGAKVEVPRLMKKKVSQLLNINSSLNTTNNSQYDPFFAIGTQEGEGGGLFTVEDTLTLVGSDSVTVDDNHWRTNPEEHEDSYTLTIPTNFVNSSITLNISNIAALDDWRLIENDSTSAIDRSSNTFYEFAQEFIVEEEYINVSSLRLYIDMIDNFEDGLTPNGTLLLLNDASGFPDDSDVIHSQALESHPSIAGLIEPNNWAGWLDYSFSPEITLPKGNYWFILNDTTSVEGVGYWNWYTVDDSGQIDKGDVNFKFGHGDTWTPYSGRDIVMMPKVCPVQNISSTYPAKKYTDPSALDFQYKTSSDSTGLSTFTLFDGNITSDNIHSFTVNTSVNFELSWWITVNYSNNPITPSSYYKAMNNTDIAWNLTFNHAKVSTTYQVLNHTLTISGIPSDWNGTQIYWNDSLTPEYSDLTNDVNVTWDGDPAHKYTYGNTTMVVNASTLVTNTTWNIWFIAPNYLISFNLLKGGQVLDFPYEANVTDTLGLNIQVLESGGNTSYWIEDFNQQTIHKQTDFSSSDFTDMWIIDDNVSQTTNVNGTYDLQAFWVSSDKTKIGTTTRNLNVFINTTLTINSTETIEVLIGEKITIWANYTSNHNSTTNNPSHIDNAMVWCNVSWPEGAKQNETMNQPIGTYYNASFTTGNEDPGTTGTITITTELPWFVNWSKTINVKFIGKSSITANETNLILTWRENTTLRVYYNDSVNNPITDATIIINGDGTHPAEYDLGSGAYDYKLNSTQYNGVGTYLNLNITATHTYYQNQTLYFNLIINPADTSINDASVNPIDYPLKVTNGSTFYFWVIWFSEYGDPLNDSDGVGITSSDVVLNSSDLTTGNHTFMFVPTSIGPINVTLSFQIENYNAAIFHINVTSIESTTLAVNEINIILTWRENNSLEIFYNNSIGTPIQGATIIVDGDTSHSAVYNSISGAYYYPLNSTHYNGVGNYLNLNITAQKTYYEDQILYFDLTINPADSSINDASVNPVDYPLEVTNGSTFYFWVVWYSEYEDPLNDSDGIGISSSDVVLHTSNPSTGNHTFKFIPTTIGPINVTLTFQIENYNAAIFHINVTSIESTDLAVNNTNIVLTWRGNTTLEIWYNDSASVPIPSATIIVDGDTSHPAVYNVISGAYLYRLNSTSYNGMGDYLNLKITAQKLYYQNQTIYFDLTINSADSSINDASVNPLDYPLEVTNGSIFDFWIIWLNEYEDPLNDSDGVEISSLDVILISTDPTTGNHTFRFIPTSIGPINVTLTFQIPNYNSAKFHLNVTSIESTSFSVNETNLVLIWRGNTTLEIWYNNSANVPVSGATIVVDGDSNHPAVFNSSSGAYYYQFNSTNYDGVGDYLNLNITAQKLYYQSQILFFDLTINPADSSIDDTSVNSVDYPLDVTNGSAFYFWVIWLSEYGDPLNDSDGVGITSSDVVLNSSDLTTGNHTFKFVPTTIGPINVTLTFQIPNYLAAIFHINTMSTENTSFSTSETNLMLLWRENTTLLIWYNDSSNNSINGATIIIDGDTDHPAIFNASSGAYSYRLNSTNYDGVGTYLNLNISGSKTYYQNQTLYFNLTINPADSSIEDASVNPLDYPLEVTNGSAFYFWVIWLSQYGDALNDSDGVVISNSEIELNLSDSVTGNHTFKLLPTTIGPINFTLTFQIDNYNAAYFNINVTSIERTSLSLNETNVVLHWQENTNLEIWFNNSFNFPIQGATIIVDRDTSHPAIYNSSSGAYYYQLNSTKYSGVGSYLNLNITADRTYYQNQTINFNLTINPADTYFDRASVNPVDYPLDVTNGSAFYFWVIWFSEYGDPLNDSNGIGISNSDVMLNSSNPVTGNHTFKFVPTTIGPINVTLSFEITNYLSATFNINVTSIERTSFTVTDSDLVLIWRENTTLEIWYNDSASVPIPGATIIIDGDTSHPAVYNSSSGFYFYLLNSTRYGGVGTYLNLKITAHKTYYQNQTLFFDLIIDPASSFIATSSVNPVDYPLDVTNGSIFYFWIIWISEYGNPLNDSDGISISNSDIVLDSTDPSTGNHTFKFVPAVIGPINVTLTFQIDNYNSASFNINVTSIENTNLTAIETAIVLTWRENATLQIWYNDSTSVPIPGAMIIIDGDTIHPAVFNSSSGAYQYQLNSMYYGGVGSYLNLNITAFRTYYQNQTILFDLTIIPSDSSIESTSLKLYPEINNVPSDENFDFWVIWKSEFNDALNASNGVLINGSLNNHPDLYLFNTDANNGNHSFIFFYSGTVTLIYNLTFSIENYNKQEFLIRFNVFNRTMVIDNGLSNPMSGQTIDFLQSGEIYYFSVFINDSSTNFPLNTTILDLPENVDFLDYTDDGNHTFLFNATQIGIFSDLTIVFTLQNYNSLNYNISFIVSPREMVLDSGLSTQQSIDYLLYGDIFYFVVYLNDSRTGVPLNISSFNNLPASILFENFSVAKGHLFRYQITEIGNFIFEINFTKKDYTSYTHSLMFNVSKGNSELIPSTSSITTYYSQDSAFSIVWQSVPNPNISSSPILRISNTSNILIQSTSPEWEDNIILQEMMNGNFTFSVLSNQVGTTTITLNFLSDNYNSISIDIEISMILVPTFEPIVSFPSELVIGESLIISGSQWLSIYDENVPIEKIALINDTLPVSFTLVEVTVYSFVISIDTEDFRQGFHNLTLLVSSYGYEDHSITIFVEIKGRDVEISIVIYPEELIQGSDFTITAILTYASLQANLEGQGSELLLVPLEGIPVTFLVRIKYANDSILPLSYVNSTNELGEAKFTVSGKYTLSAVGIESITVSSEVTASGKESTKSTPSNFYDTHKFKKKTTDNSEELIILGIMALLSGIGLTSSIRIYRTRKRKKEERSEDKISTKITSKSTPKEKPKVAPRVILPIKETDDTKVQPQTKPKGDIKQSKAFVEKSEDKVVKTDTPQTKPASWINEFPLSLSDCEEEIKYLFNLVLNREGQWYGKTSYNYLLKRKTVDLSTTNLKKVYMNIPQHTSFFFFEKTSITITEEGRKISSRILGNSDPE